MHAFLAPNGGGASKLGHVRPCVLLRPKLKLGMIMDLSTIHMHIDWIFDPIHNGRLAAIFDVKTGPVMGVSDFN